MIYMGSRARIGAVARVAGLLLLLAFAAATQAEDGSDLYEAEVAVEDQSPQQREQAIRKALEQVLEQLADERDIAVPDKTRNTALRKAQRYVQQYGYTDGGLWVRFDRRALDELLQEPGAEAAPVAGNLLLLKVSGVRTLADYVRVAEHLGTQKFARGLQPLLLEPDSVLFQLAARGEPDAVTRAIGRGGLLQPMGEEAGIPSFLYSP